MTDPTQRVRRALDVIAREPHLLGPLAAHPLPALLTRDVGGTPVVAAYNLAFGRLVGSDVTDTPISELLGDVRPARRAQPVAGRSDPTWWSPDGDDPSRSAAREGALETTLRTAAGERRVRLRRGPASADTCELWTLDPIGPVCAAEDILAAQSLVLEMVARGWPVDEVLDELVRLVESRTPGYRCALLLYGEGGSSVPPRWVAPSFPPDSLPDPAAVEEVSCVTLPMLGARGIGVRTRELGKLCLFRAAAPDLADRAVPTRLVAHVVDLAAIALERDEAEIALRRSSLADPLTGLANRTLFLDRLKAALARAQREERQVGVIFLDLDRFKVINDSMGHEAGDELIRQIARRLRTTVRPHDTVARFGGDEFTVVCENVHGSTEAEQIAERLRAVLAEPVIVSGRELFVSASLGVAVGDPTRGVVHPEELLRHADAAMYRAKEGGRARVARFDQEMLASARDRLRTETALRRALERGEFRLDYQPEIDLDKRRVVGVEALLRWTHPELGQVEPGDFVPVAEETGMIVPIGEWVLDEAARQAREWLDVHGTSPVIAVNLSPRQFLQPGLVDVVRSCLQAHRLPARYLRLELTESMLGEPVRTARLLAELKDLGVSLSVDDFGTGYSSLARLRQFCVDELKIDRSFIGGLGYDPNDSAVVNAIVGMARALGLEVVAEGVESQIQLDELAALGCDRAQGFYLARPRSAVAVTPLLLAADPVIFVRRADASAWLAEVS